MRINITLTCIHWYCWPNAGTEPVISKADETISSPSDTVMELIADSSTIVWVTVVPVVPVVSVAVVPAVLVTVDWDVAVDDSVVFSVAPVVCVTVVPVVPVVSVAVVSAYKYYFR